MPAGLFVAVLITNFHVGAGCDAAEEACAADTDSPTPFVPFARGMLLLQACAGCTLSQVPERERVAGNMSSASPLVHKGHEHVLMDVNSSAMIWTSGGLEPQQGMDLWKLDLPTEGEETFVRLQEEKRMGQHEGADVEEKQASEEWKPLAPIALLKVSSGDFVGIVVLSVVACLLCVVCNYRMRNPSNANRRRSAASLSAKRASRSSKTSASSSATASSPYSTASSTRAPSSVRSHGPGNSTGMSWDSWRRPHRRHGL